MSYGDRVVVTGNHVNRTAPSGWMVRLVRRLVEFELADLPSIRHGGRGYTDRLRTEFLGALQELSAHDLELLALFVGLNRLDLEFKVEVECSHSELLVLLDGQLNVGLLELLFDGDGCWRRIGCGEACADE